MSSVTDVVFLCSVLEEAGETEDGSDGPVPGLDALNAWLKEHGYAPRNALVRVDAMAGGNKSMQAIAAVGAFNYLVLDDFLAAARAIKWEAPDWVSFAIQEEHSEVFQLFRLAPNTEVTPQEPPVAP